MSDETTAASTTPRPGSAQDLVRRIERVEEKQDDQAREISALTATVTRVELNQKHADELSGIRHEALNSAVALVGGKLDQFITRIEGIITGEVQTAQSKAGEKLIADYLAWQSKVNDRLDGLEDERDAAAARSEGRRETLSWGKTALLAAAAVAGPVITVIIALQGSGS